MKQQKGFTLIELIVVIVILGILAATALPKFVDLTDDAEGAAIKGVAGGLASASATNYAACATTGQSAVAGKCVQVDHCADVGTLMLPSMTIGTAASSTTYYLSDDAAVTNGNTATCTLKKDKASGGGSYSQAYTAIGAGNP